MKGYESVNKPNTDVGADELDALLADGQTADLTPHEDKEYTRPAGVEPFVIKKTADELLLVYSPKNGASFVDDNIRLDGECRVASRVFVFSKNDVKDFGSSNIASRTFVIARSSPESQGYYLMPGRILDIPHDVLFFKDVEVRFEWFTPIESGARLSVFQKISRLIDEDIVIGGHDEKSIPYEYWEHVVNQFPRKTEIAHYVESRIENLLKEYLPTIKNGDSLLQKYLAKLKTKAPQPKRLSNWVKFDAYELGKYQFLYEQLAELIDQDEMSEIEWEKQILRFIQLLYPRYICTLRQLVVHEWMTNPKKRTKRQIDIALFDADGHIDVIEIKKPSVGTIFRSAQDHDNNIPSLALSKTIMQIEKYVLYLQKGGYELERELNASYAKFLPGKIPIKVVNPRGIIVFGRSRDLSADQVLDFEVLRRKFSHIADIMTYDDLLTRFKNILSKFEKPASIRAQIS